MAALIPEKFFCVNPVTRKTGKKGHSNFRLLLASQGHPFAVTFDMGGSETLLSGDKSVSHQGIVFKEGQRRTVVCVCRRDSLVVMVDGKTLFEWKGDYEALKPGRNEAVDDFRLGIHTRNSHFVISKIEVRPLRGEEEAVREQ